MCVLSRLCRPLKVRSRLIVLANAVSRGEVEARSGALNIYAKRLTGRRDRQVLVTLKNIWEGAFSIDTNGVSVATNALELARTIVLGMERGDQEDDLR